MRGTIGTAPHVIVVVIAITKEGLSACSALCTHDVRSSRTSSILLWVVPRRCSKTVDDELYKASKQASILLFSNQLPVKVKSRKDRDLSEDTNAKYRLFPRSTS